MSLPLRLLPALALMLPMAACANEDIKPQLTEALNRLLDKPACLVGGSDFSAFPVTVAKDMFDDGANYRSAGQFEALAAVGLVTATGERTYDLTELGRAAHDAKRGGFCFADGFAVDEITLVEPIAQAQLGPKADAGWSVEFIMTPVNFETWVLDPALKQAGPLFGLDQYEGEPETKSIRAYRAKGSDVVELETFLFSHRPDIGL